MTARRTRMLACLGIAAVAAATTLSGAGGASAASRSASVVPTYTNGEIAYSCLGYGGAAGRDGWITTTPGGGALWSYWGKYYGGVSYSPDGSEMVHDATFTDTPTTFGGRNTPHTVFLSESDGDYPWQDTNFDGNFSVADTDTTFTADGKHVLFTRSTASTHTIEEIEAAGQETPDVLPQPPGANSTPAASVLGDIAFVNVAATGPNAGVPWVWILPSGSTTPVALVAGTKPKFSPDGGLVAFVSGNRLHTMTTTGASITDVGAAAFAGPITDYAWSPDGSEWVVGMAYQTGQVFYMGQSGLLESIPITKCLTRGTQVAWQSVPTTKDQVVRVWGSTRENTSIAVSHAGFPTDGTADAVVLADSYHFPDALSGAPLAGFVHGPMLLTPGSQSTALPAIVTEIRRALGSTSKPIYILGGTGSVSQGIEDQLTLLGYTVHRLGGANRYLTSLAIAQFMGQGANAPEQILLATGTDFPDGLSAGAAAASYWPSGGGGAVLLTNGASMVSDVQDYITAALAAQTPTRHVYVTTAGGLADKAYPGTKSNPKISCVGQTRYDTSGCVAEVHFGAQQYAAIATGTSFPDALSGGAYAGAINAPLLLVPPSLDGSDESSYFLHAASGAISIAYAFGGTGVITSTQFTQLGQIIGLGTLPNEITPPTPVTAKSRTLAKPAQVTKPVPVSAPDRTTSR